MALNKQHFTEDPATGERVSLRELSERHDQPYPRICKRYSSGKRGWDLVAAASESRMQAGQALAERMRERRGERPELRRIIAELRQNPVNAAMMRPLVRKAG